MVMMRVVAGCPVSHHTNFPRKMLRSRCCLVQLNAWLAIATAQNWQLIFNERGSPLGQQSCKMAHHASWQLGFQKKPGKSMIGSRMTNHIFYFACGPHNGDEADTHLATIVTGQRLFNANLIVPIHHHAQ